MEEYTTRKEDLILWYLKRFKMVTHGTDIQLICPVICVPGVYGLSFLMGVYALLYCIVNKLCQECHPGNKRHHLFSKLTT